MHQLEQWALRTLRPGSFTAPEFADLVLTGYVLEHPKHTSGKRVRTSPVVQVQGNRVTTASGSVYILGEPEEGYAQYCREIGLPIDPEQPIRVKK
jgi:hypothetical protein